MKLTALSGDSYVVPFVESLEEVFDIVLTVLTQGGFFFFFESYHIYFRDEDIY